MSSISQTAVGSRIPCVVGQLVDTSPNNDVQSGINSAPQAYQVSTVTFTAPTGDSVLTVNGYSVTCSSDGSPTAAEHAAGLVALAVADPYISASVSVVDSGAGVITLTSLWPGLAFTVACTNGGETPAVATSTANDEADAVAFGRALILRDYSEIYATSVDGSESGEKLVSIPGSALGNQVDTWTITYDASVLINVSIEVNGSVYSASHLMATDLATSITAIVAQLNAALPANTVLAEATATTIVLTSEIDGMPFVSSVSFGTGRDTGAAVLVTTGEDYDISKLFAGVSMHSYQVEDADEYPGNSVLPFVSKGLIAVEGTESVTPGAQVWVELSTGKFFASGSAALRCPLPLSKAKWARNLGGTFSFNVLSVSA